jgi:hypothetical protein
MELGDTIQVPIGHLCHSVSTGNDFANFVRQRDDVPRRDHVFGQQQFGYTTYRTRNARPSAGHRFEQGLWKALSPRRKNKDICAIELRSNRIPRGQLTEKPHSRRNTPTVSLPLQHRTVPAITDDPQPQVQTGFHT